ncbi:MAG: hypothetical protein EOP83_02750 [Verrucomicrobiaceae bacterium]|nr:MAG: hypothetical protein EOP83_02750 [Verrucomicrobiaceae bacterium]
MGKKKGFLGWIKNEKKFLKRSKKREYTTIEFRVGYDSSKLLPRAEMIQWCQENAIGRIYYRGVDVRRTDESYSPDGMLWPSFAVIATRHLFSFENADSAFAFKMRWV